jgi:hypothetical protein
MLGAVVNLRLFSTLCTGCYVRLELFCQLPQAAAIVQYHGMLA